MLITIPDVLTAEEVAQARTTLDAAEWIDGKVTAGYQAGQSRRICSCRRDIQPP